MKADISIRHKYRDSAELDIGNFRTNVTGSVLRLDIKTDSGSLVVRDDGLITVIQGDLTIVIHKGEVSVTGKAALAISPEAANKASVGIA